MTPRFRIDADGADITALIGDRLIAISVVDEAGWQSDRAEIRLDDRDGALVLPPTGAGLDIALGTATDLVALGHFIVDELTLEGPPAALTIRAQAAEMKASLKAPRTRAWRSMTLGAIVAEIAARHGYTPAVAAGLAGLGVPYLAQTEESDLHLLTRLARDHGAVAKPAGLRLVFVPRGQAKAASGRAIAPITLTPAEVSSWRATIADRGRYKSVIARHHDIELAEEVTATAGAGEPAYRLRHVYPDFASASSAAAARLAELARGTVTVSLTLPGRPEIAAETPLTLSGFRGGIDASYTVVRAEHTFDARGLISRIEAEVKG